MNRVISDCGVKGGIRDSKPLLFRSPSAGRGENYQQAIKQVAGGIKHLAPAGRRVKALRQSSASSSASPHMPGKGHALDKFEVNEKHKKAKREQAQAAAAALSPSGALEVCCFRCINTSDLSDARKADAQRAVREASDKILKGVNPFTGLHPPPKCAPCNGTTGGTHHFLCRKRERQPGQQEQRVRAQVERELRKAYNEKCNADQTVRARRPPRLTHLLCWR